MNNVVFVGGPYDGQVRAVETLGPIPVHGHRPVPDSPDEPAAELIGHYVHGTGGQRGKMMWRPTGSDQEGTSS